MKKEQSGTNFETEVVHLSKRNCTIVFDVLKSLFISSGPIFNNIYWKLDSTGDKPQWINCVPITLLDWKAKWIILNMTILIFW